MSRIPGHTIDDDPPEAAGPLLKEIANSAPAGRILNLHTQMAHAPSVLTVYTAIRQAGNAYGTLGPRTRSALMLACAGVTGSVYAVAATAMLAARAGWNRAQVGALRGGSANGDPAIDAIARVVRQAAGGAGQASDDTWQQAIGAGLIDEQLAEAFTYLGLTVFTVYSLTYAQNPLDLTAGAPAGPERQG